MDLWQSLLRRPRALGDTGLVMGDWSNPGTTVITGVEAIGFYLGGATPHVWTTTQIRAQTVAPMLPIWVYSSTRPGAANGTAEGNAAVTAAKALGIGSGCRLVIDMEGLVDAAYVGAFHAAINAAGYWLVIYGSASTVFGNWSGPGPGGGFWVADWTGVPHLYPHSNVWATQWAAGTGMPGRFRARARRKAVSTALWDQSTLLDLTRLWHHKSASYTLTVTATDGPNSVSRPASFVVV